MLPVFYLGTACSIHVLTSHVEPASSAGCFRWLRPSSHVGANLAVEHQQSSKLARALFLRRCVVGMLVGADTSSVLLQMPAEEVECPIKINVGSST